MRNGRLNFAALAVEKAKKKKKCKNLRYEEVERTQKGRLQKTNTTRLWALEEK